MIDFTVTRNIELDIEVYDNFTKPYLLKRVDGTYEQHCHFENKQDALDCIHIIQNGLSPKNKKQAKQLKRLLTDEEFKRLNKKEKYYNQNYCMKR